MRIRCYSSFTIYIQYLLFGENEDKLRSQDKKCGPLLGRKVYCSDYKIVTVCKNVCFCIFQNWNKWEGRCYCETECVHSPWPLLHAAQRDQHWNIGGSSQKVRGTDLILTMHTFHNVTLGLCVFQIRGQPHAKIIWPWAWMCNLWASGS